MYPARFVSTPRHLRPSTRGNDSDQWRLPGLARHAEWSATTQVKLEVASARQHRGLTQAPGDTARAAACALMQSRARTAPTFFPPLVPSPKCRKGRKGRRHTD
jgi:hypothetical protein